MAFLAAVLIAMSMLALCGALFVVVGAVAHLAAAVNAHAAKVEALTTRALVLSAQTAVLDETLKKPLRIEMAQTQTRLVAPIAKGTH